MNLFYCDHYDFFLPPGHRFPIDKYRLLRERILREGLVPPERMIASAPAIDDQLLRVHRHDYLQKLKPCSLTAAEERRLGFPWSAGLLERSRRAAMEDGL